MSGPPTQPGLADRLRGVVVAARGELHISRHVFRAGPAYVLRDPISFATHRIDPEDYRVFSAIRGDLTLGETFDGLVASGELDRADEEAFYALVLDLHQRSLLSLPINDADKLYERFQRRRRAENLSRAMGIFFLRIPLVNPDQFLTRTLPLFGWLFTRPALIGWMALSVAALAVAASRWRDLTSPVLTVLDGNNMFMLFGALIALKIIHEFGHAYACKAFGGHVPEMGVFLVLFTPLAYVDATDSWTFSETRRRAIVTLGGVYFESIIGAIAMFVWASSEAGTLNTLAYQVVILSTVTTAVFNLNPLLRYDAYYLVSDLSGIPNLRQRCSEAVAGLLKRTLYGLKVDKNGEAIRPHAGLVAFGLAQVSYRVVVLLTISTVLIMKFGGIGLGLGVVLIGMGVAKSLMALVRYLVSSEETAPVRMRAYAVTGAVAAAAIGGALLIPAPWPVDARGVVSFEDVALIRAPHRAEVVDVPVRIGEPRRKGESLAALRNPDLESEERALRSELETARARTVLAAMRSPGEATMAEADVRQASARLAQVGDDLQALEIEAPADGRVLDVLVRETGRAVEEGEPVLVYASGSPEAVFHVRMFEFESLRLSVGESIECRAAAHPERAVIGRVTHIGRVATRDVASRVSALAPGGLVPVNAATGEAADPYFEIRLRLDPQDAALAGAGLRARFPAHYRTTAQVLERRVKRFLNTVREGADG